MELLEERWTSYWDEGFDMNLFTNGYAWYFLLLIVFEFVLLNQKKMYVSANTPPDTPLNYDKGYDYRVNVFFAILVFLPLVFIAANRGYHADTFLHITMFNEYPSNISEISDYVDWDGKAPGFTVFSIIIKQLFGPSYETWLFIIAAISAGGLAITYKRYTSEVVLCAFFFFASTDFFSWMMNGMRQFLVASLLFACFPLLQKKKTFLLFVAIALVLYTIHTSAIIVIPLYIAALGKPFNKKTLISLGLMLIAIVFAGQFLGLMDSALEDTAYNGVVSQFEGDDGTNIFRVLMYSVPAILVIVYRKKIPDDVPTIIGVCINMSLITMGLYALSMFTSGIYIGRMPIYFSLFNYILLPWEMRTFFPESRSTMNYAMIGGYLAFFVIQNIFWGNL